MHWSLDSDLRNSAIASAMSRNRFREILKFLHFADNTKLDSNDKFAKIRPLIKHLNEKFIHFMPSEKNIDVDESMVPYYSHHSCKQRIQGKPIRYGFKFWSMNLSNGYLISTDAYQGKGTRMVDDGDLGLGASVVLTFANRLNAKYTDCRFNFFTDNFFTGLSLTEKMTNLGYGCTGTIRENRIGNCPLKKNSMKSSARGSIDSFCNSEKNLIIIQWKDNSIVQVASNCFGVNPTKLVKRYSAADKKYIQVEMPHAINQYNCHMGGTDLMDRNVSNYRIKIRNNKWWWQIFTHLLSASISNAWLLHRISHDNNIVAKEESFKKLATLDLLGFIRYIAQTYLLLGRKKECLGRPKTVKEPLFHNIPTAVTNNTSVFHYPDSFRQNRCKVCKKNTTFGCGVCLVNLHPINCFKTFHLPT
ncbi:hypothetical protein FQR65_LT16336 [Abscondita terminalis]|nr:hypothetical protein FQR65_LT16336 [Abscondita terminalis]